jgi:hypothetical protein
MPNTRPDSVNPVSNSDQIATMKNPNSMAKRMIPGTTIGALPERLGSFGTLNIPHIDASNAGKPNARINFNHPSL